MNKTAVISGLCFLFICLALQPFTIAYDNIQLNIKEEKYDLLEIQYTDIIIHNPYSEVDFQTTNYYKANLHTHTTESDGSSSPAEVIYHYHERGEYAILAITDHNKNTWPWNEWISEKPLEQSDSSEYYPGLNILAVSGNEMSKLHHRGSFLNSYSGGGMFLRLTFWYIQKRNGLSIFYHPGRYSYDVDWYQQYIDNYKNCIVGIEVYNQGDRYSDDRLLWDRINKERDSENLIWGFSNDDMHHIKSHSFRNYQHFLMDNLSEDEFRNAMIEGAFYFSYEPNGSDSENPSYGLAMTPKIIDVNIQGNSIQITGDNANSFYWYDEDSLIVGMTSDIDVSTIDSNFVRAVLINEYGNTYTQPFGITIRNLERPTDDV